MMLQCQQDRIEDEDGSIDEGTRSRGVPAQKVHPAAKNQSIDDDDRERWHGWSHTEYPDPECADQNCAGAGPELGMKQGPAMIDIGIVQRQQISPSLGEVLGDDSEACIVEAAGAGPNGVEDNFRSNHK